MNLSEKSVDRTLNSSLQKSVCVVLFHQDKGGNDTTLQTNASKKGLGAVTLQDSKPVIVCIEGP